MATKQTFSGWEYQIESDDNYPDFINVSFFKPNKDKFTKEDSKDIKKLFKKLKMDGEQIMEGVYSFDVSLSSFVEEALVKTGMTKFIEINTYIPSLSDDDVEEQNDDKNESIIDSLIAKQKNTIR